MTIPRRCTMGKIYNQVSGSWTLWIPIQKLVQVLYKVSGGWALCAPIRIINGKATPQSYVNRISQQNSAFLRIFYFFFLFMFSVFFKIAPLFAFFGFCAFSWLSAFFSAFFSAAGVRVRPTTTSLDVIDVLWRRWEIF